MDDTSPCRTLCINLRLRNAPSGQTNTEDPVGLCVLTLDSLMPQVVKQIQKIQVSKFQRLE